MENIFCKGECTAPVRSLCSKASCQIASKTKQSHSARSLLRQSIAKRSLPSFPLFLFSLSFSITLLQPHEQALISVSLSLQLDKAYSPMTTNSRHSGLGAASRERWLLHLDPGVQAREGIFVRSCCQLLFSPVGNTSVSKHRNQTNVPTVGWCQTNWQSLGSSAAQELWNLEGRSTIL